MWDDPQHQAWRLRARWNMFGLDGQEASGALRAKVSRARRHRCDIGSPSVGDTISGLSVLFCCHEGHAMRARTYA